MKALGVKRGFPDLVMPTPDGGLAIEMKSDTGQTTDEQDAWLAYLRVCGWKVAVCRSAEEGRAVILGHFEIPTDSLPGV